VRILTSRFARAKGEEGATAVIVVLCIIAMFGMIVLVMDVGGLLLRRRSMVNGADAAALAAAKSCVLAASADPRTPEQAADEWAADNVNGVNTGPTNILQIANCDGGTSAPSGYVSVRYQAPQDLFFAPVLGYPDTGTVTTDATAIWGPPGAANPIPIVIYSSSFNNCQLDTDPTPGSRCYVWEDNGNTTGAQSAFGLLDLRTDDPSRYGWDSVPGAQCSDTGSGPNDWIGDYPSSDIGNLPSNYPAPTYVCRSNGFQQSAWSLLEQLEGQILFFPVNRCYDTPVGNETDGQISSSVQPVACGATPHQYDIIGFVAFRLIDVLRPQQAQPTSGNCGPFTRAFPASSPLNLDTAGITQGCFTSAPQVIDPTSVSVTRISGGGPSNPQPVRGPDGPTCVGAPNDYCYDPTTRSVVWNIGGPAQDNQNYNVSFSWIADGPCGIPPGNNSSHCLVVDYVDIQIGGSGPTNGPSNSNIRAYKLCEPTSASTCAPINVPVP